MYSPRKRQYKELKINGETSEDESINDEVSSNQTVKMECRDVKEEKFSLAGKTTTSSMYSPSKAQYKELKIKDEVSEDEKISDEARPDKTVKVECIDIKGGKKPKDVFGNENMNANFGIAGFENPYAAAYNVLRNQILEEKAAVLKSIQFDSINSEMKADVLAEAAKRADQKKQRKKKIEGRDSPYGIRDRKNINYNENQSTSGLLPLRRLSPRIAGLPLKSLNEDSILSEAANEEQSRSRREGPLKMQDIIIEENDTGNWIDDLQELGSYLKKPSKNEVNEEIMGKRWVSVIGSNKTAKRYWENPVKSENLDEFKSRVSKLKLWCGSMTKVVRERITSMAVHPSKHCLIVVAGGKKGSLGLWVVNPELNNEIGPGKRKPELDIASGVNMFHPHDGLINCMSFCTFRGDRLFTTSYDGIIRVLDLENLVFNQVYASPADLTKNWMQWHCQMSPNVLLASQGTGNVYVFDDRSQKDYEAVLNCYDRSCRTVSIHPLYPQYLATASSSGYTSIWDLRKFKAKGSSKNASLSPAPGTLSKEAAICHLGGAKQRFSSSFFSPVTGSGLLTTTTDDYISIYDTSKLIETSTPSTCRVETRIKHNNRTGRWLTPFRAAWHPQRDDAFVVGSMAQPRQVEIFGRHGRCLTSLGTDGPFPINTVCPVNVFHPYRLVLASGDSGGRVHLLL